MLGEQQIFYTDENSLRLNNTFGSWMRFVNNYENVRYTCTLRLNNFLSTREYIYG